VRERVRLIDSVTGEVLAEGVRPEGLPEFEYGRDDIEATIRYYRIVARIHDVVVITLEESPPASRMTRRSRW
jgi:hypothetical protein